MCPVDSFVAEGVDDSLPVHRESLMVGPTTYQFSADGQVEISSHVQLYTKVLGKEVINHLLAVR